jgi:hypothetical protein
VKASWHGLLFDFYACPDDGGPGLRPGFHIEINEVQLEDEEEFRFHHPASDVAEVERQYAQQIDDYLYSEVARGAGC